MAIEKGDIRADTRNQSVWAQYGRRHESINNQIFANAFANALAVFDYRQATQRPPTLVKMKRPDLVLICVVIRLNLEK
ncbi:hypothetical protein [Pseudomonas sp. EA_5y_Pfl2_R50]|uniref:hypothetical protein n=1 Tax=Pseudomonas sp. EA_5y_Pfl2_R50 TaxID=3088691 RepID=UPI0030DC3F8D